MKKKIEKQKVKGKKAKRLSLNIVKTNVKAGVLDVYRPPSVFLL